MKKDAERLLRPCRKCDNMFQPIGKFTYICDDCKYNHLRGSWVRKHGKD